MDGNSPERMIQSDRHLFDIIEQLNERETVGVAELAETVGLAKSTVHGHLTTLRQRGYAVKTNEGYKLGLEFLNHGKEVQLSYPIFPLAEKKINQIADETGERVWCVVEENGVGYYLCGAKGDQSIYPPAHAGTRDPLHCMAAGKAILAHMRKSEIEAVLDKHGLEEKTAKSITERTALFAELSEVKEDGYATNNEELIPGLCAIGAPVVDEGGTIFGALSISGPKNRIDSSEIRDRLASLLMGSANELAFNLSETHSM